MPLLVNSIENSPEEYSSTYLNDCVNNLYRYRDHYFETHSLSEAIRKQDDVKNKLQSTLETLEKFQDEAVADNRAMFYYLKGRALNIIPDYDKTAEELLSKAVKLDPKLVEAWNELGECYWKNDNIQEAKNCFTAALPHGKSKVSLRNLSMVARQEPVHSRDERIKNIEGGLVYAKDAVAQDPQDGTSWTVLGNAHLSSFFTISQNPKTLKLCMSAYLQAEKDVVAKSNPDLHYNKAIALKYEENYQQSLESFSRALALDPTWDSPKLKEQQLIKYLRNVTELVNSNGKMKGKRLQQLLQAMDDKLLGPYYGGKYTSPNGQSVKLEPCTILDLAVGLNEEKVLLGKVVCSVQNEDCVPFTFCLVDKEAKCVAVTVYNLAEGKGVIIGDTVAIPEPYFSTISLSYNNKSYSFRSIRVESPLVMVVNGKKLGKDQQAGTRLTTFKKVE